jgi:hypothetical protein
MKKQMSHFPPFLLDYYLIWINNNVQLRRFRRSGDVVKILKETKYGSFTKKYSKGRYSK